PTPTPTPEPAQPAEPTQPAATAGPAGPEPRTIRRTTTPPTAQDPVRTMERLMTDPALRLNESGRHLLRMLTSSLPPAAQRDQLVRSVPPHCAERISQLALECAAAWREFARLVETAQPAPGALSA
ncbi:hypothetical protein ACFWIS_38590, partial [Kitasatospora sp. NPDC127060]